MTIVTDGANKRRISDKNGRRQLVGYRNLKLTRNFVLTVLTEPVREKSSKGVQCDGYARWVHRFRCRYRSNSNVTGNRERDAPSYLIGKHYGDSNASRQRSFYRNPVTIRFVFTLTTRSVRFDWPSIIQRTRPWTWQRQIRYTWNVRF